MTCGRSNHLLPPVGQTSPNRFPVGQKAPVGQSPLPLFPAVSLGFCAVCGTAAGLGLSFMGGAEGDGARKRMLSRFCYGRLLSPAHSCPSPDFECCFMALRFLCSFSR